MNNINNEILECVDMIDDCVMESELNVMESLCEYYSKSIMILENYEGDNLESFSVFQESVIMENGVANTAKSIGNAIWNGLLRIASFIRRMFSNASWFVQYKIFRKKQKFPREISSPISQETLNAIYSDKAVDQLVQVVNSCTESIKTDNVSNETVSKIQQVQQTAETAVQQTRPGNVQQHKIPTQQLVQAFDKYQQKAQQVEAAVNQLESVVNAKVNEMNKSTEEPKKEKLSLMNKMMTSLTRLVKGRGEVDKCVDGILKNVNGQQNQNPQNNNNQQPQPTQQTQVQPQPQQQSQQAAPTNVSAKNVVPNNQPTKPTQPQQTIQQPTNQHVQNNQHPNIQQQTQRQPVQQQQSGTQRQQPVQSQNTNTQTVHKPTPASKVVSVKDRTDLPDLSKFDNDPNIGNFPEPPPTFSDMPNPPNIPELPKTPEEWDAYNKKAAEEWKKLPQEEKDRLLNMPKPELPKAPEPPDFSDINIPDFPDNLGF